MIKRATTAGQGGRWSEHEKLCLKGRQVKQRCTYNNKHPISCQEVNFRNRKGADNEREHL